MSDLSYQFEVKLQDDDLGAASIELHGTCSDGSVFVGLETPLINFQLDNGESEVIYTSRLGWFEDFNDIQLNSDRCREFTPADDDFFLSPIDRDKIALNSSNIIVTHRIISIHPSGAILFNTYIIDQSIPSQTQIGNAGTFIKRNYFEDPIKIPFDNVLSFSDDPHIISIFYLNDEKNIKILRYDPKTKSWSSPYISIPENANFLGGAIDNYLLFQTKERSDNPLKDGRYIEYLTNTRTNSINIIGNVARISALDQSGIVVGLNSDIQGSYWSANGTSNEFTCNEKENDCVAMVNQIRQTNSNNFLLATGHIGKVHLIDSSNPFIEKVYNIRPQFGTIWLSKMDDIANGSVLYGLSLNHLISDKLGSNVLNCKSPTKLSSMIIELEDGRSSLLALND